MGQAGTLMREMDERVRSREKASFGGSGQPDHEAVFRPQPGLYTLVYPKTAHVEDPGGRGPTGDHASNEPRDVASSVNEAYR